MKGPVKNNAKAKPSAPKGAAKAPAKKPPAKAASPAKVAVTAKKPVPAGKPAASKSVPAPAAKKKPEPPKKAPAPAAKGKKEDAKPAKPAAPVASAKGAVPAAKGAAPAVKAALPAKATSPAKGAKVPAAAKVPVVKAVKPPKPPKVPRVKKIPVVKGPMEKAQRSLAATAARAAAKDKVPPSKALAAVQEAKLKAGGKGAAKIIAADVKAAPKKPVKAFFQEVAPGAERIIKRGDKTTATPIPADIQNRRRGGGGEESPEELVERIERELENQHIFKRNMLRPQLCTKCGINQVSERFTIDKELGYCDDCAEILHLGETKEARKIDFHPTLMKKEGEPGAEGEAAEEEDDDDEDDVKGPPAGAVPEID